MLEWMLPMQSCKHGISLLYGRKGLIDPYFFWHEFSLQ